MKRLVIAILLGCLMLTGCGKKNAVSDVTDTLVESSESAESTADMEMSEEGSDTQESEAAESSEADEETEETEESTESTEVSDGADETTETEETLETPAPTEDVESGETEETKESAEPTKEPEVEKTPEPTPTPTPTPAPTPTPTPEPTPEPTPVPTPVPTPEPTPVPTPTPTPEPTPTPHVHNYVTTTRWEADCNQAKAVWDICSCGEYVNARDVGEKLGHIPDESGGRDWLHEPTCTSGGGYYVMCKRCNKSVGPYDGEPLGHDFEDTIINPDRDCKTCAVIKHHCKRCGRDEYEDDWTNLGEHVYKTFIERDYVNHEWIEWEVVKCDGCSKYLEE